MNSKLGLEIEEILLILIIVLNILDFTEMLGPFWDLVKKLISWITLGYLLYKADIHKLFFGTKNKALNITIILAFFLMIVKNIVGFGKVAIQETGEVTYNLIVNQNSIEVVQQCTSLTQCFYKLILDNAVLIETVAFYIGIALLIFVALFHLFKHMKIESPSIMSAIREGGYPPHHLGKRILRFILILIAFAGFFIIVFNLIMEWLAMAIDSHIVTIVVFIYLLFFMKHYDKLSGKSLLFKIGTSVESFYEKFIALFKYKKTILFGTSGMLVLHLLTDAGNFIIPHLFFLRDALYFEQLGHATHLPVLVQYLKQVVTLGLYDQIFLTVLYALNIIGLVLLLLIPAYFWYKASKNEKVKLPKTLVALFFSSVVVSFIAPIFKIQQIAVKNLVGVDIQTQQLISILPLSITFFIAVGIFFLSLILTYEFRKAKSYLAVILSLSFVGYYIYLFFMSMFPYYLSSITTLTQQYKFLLAIYFLIFLMITILFYFGGFITLIYEVVKDVFYRIS